MDQLPRLGKRELICLLLFTCNYVVSVWRGFLFLWVLGMGYVILLWHTLSLHIIIWYQIDVKIQPFHLMVDVIGIPAVYLYVILQVTIISEHTRI